MKWTVGWVPSAANDLAMLWTTGPDRAEITAAADAIDYRLARDPLTFGEAREENQRIVFVPPLAAYFDVDPGDCKVTVTAVWRQP